MKDFKKSYRIVRLNRRGMKPLYSVQRNTWFGWIFVRDHYEDDYPDDWAHKMKFSKKEDAIAYMNKRIENKEYLYAEKITSVEVIEDNKGADLINEFINFDYDYVTRQKV